MRTLNHLSKPRFYYIELNKYKTRISEVFNNEDLEDN